MVAEIHFLCHDLFLCLVHLQNESSQWMYFRFNVEFVNSTLNQGFPCLFLQNKPLNLQSKFYRNNLNNSQL